MTRTLLAIIRKEFFLQSRSRFAFWSRLFIQPIVAGGMTGILYAAFFRQMPESILGPLTRANTLPFILLGFNAHLLLNAGYYSLSSRFQQEWIQRTLPLLWASPVRLPLYLVAYSVIDVTKALVLTGILTVLLTQGVMTALSLGAKVLLFSIPLFICSLALGWIRTCFLMTHEGRTEACDLLYMGFMFCSCFYIPKELLPKVTWPLCENNPIYLLTAFLRGTETMNATSLLSGAVGISILVFLAWVTWQLTRSTIFDRSFAN